MTRVGWNRATTESTNARMFSRETIFEAYRKAEAVERVYMNFKWDNPDAFSLIVTSMRHEFDGAGVTAIFASA
ncbi:MAG: hypothetical protein H7144_03380 [Burkholderiales bacterium]|nr:hypothetical protein [Phycisphaerae bacterium]